MISLRELEAEFKPRLFRALQFDGVDDYVHVETLSSIQNKPINSFTFATWVKYLRDTGNTQQVFEGHTATGEILIEGKFPELSFMICYDDGYKHGVSTTLKSLGVWYFIVGTYDGRTQKLFINGELVASASRSGTFTITSGITLGGDYENEVQYLNGLIGSVYIYDRALSESEIKYLYNNPFDPPALDSLVLWLTPASIDVANGKWWDLSGNGYHGIIYGATEVLLVESDVEVL